MGRAACLCLLLAGCIEDDWNGQPYAPPASALSAASTDTGAALGPHELVGSWVSEGSDLSDLFAGPPFDYVWVTATFRADGSVAGEVEDATGQTATTLGTWTASAGSIAVEQQEPYPASLSGIYAVDGQVLTYEVVQVVPDYGFSAPTSSSGFGSTSGPGLSPGVNVQTYRRQP